MLFKSYQIENNIKNLRTNLNLFYGENVGLKDEFKNKIEENSTGSEVIRFNEEEVLKNKNLLEKEINNLSLFEKKKIIFVNNVTNKLLEIVEEIDRIELNQKVYLFADILDKKSKLRNFFEKSTKAGIIPCYEDNEITIKKIIQTKLKEYKGLTLEIVNSIFRKCKLDRSKVNNELKKIESYFLEKKLDLKKLEELIDDNKSDDFNKLKDEAFIGDRYKTNQLLSDTILDPERNFIYLNLINQRLNKMAEINTLEGRLEEKIEKIKPPIFWKDKTMFINQSKKWDNKKIKNMLDITYKAELNMKSNSSISRKSLVKKLIVDLCNVANA